MASTLWQGLLDTYMPAFGRNRRDAEIAQLIGGVSPGRPDHPGAQAKALEHTGKDTANAHRDKQSCHQPTQPAEPHDVLAKHGRGQGGALFRRVRRLRKRSAPGKRKFINATLSYASASHQK